LENGRKIAPNRGPGFSYVEEALGTVPETVFLTMQNGVLFEAQFGMVKNGCFL